MVGAGVVNVIGTGGVVVIGTGGEGATGAEGICTDAVVRCSCDGAAACEAVQVQ